MSKRKNTDYVDDLISEYNLENDSKESGEAKPETENFAELLNISLKAGSRKFSVGDKVQGKILVLGKEDVFVTIGPQKDGSMSKR